MALKKKWSIEILAEQHVELTISNVKFLFDYDFLATLAQFDSFSIKKYSNTLQYAHGISRTPKLKASPLHRIVWVAQNGPTKMIVDHIDRDTKNNKISNLRLATMSQNLANTRRGTATSQFKGVSRSTANSWFAFGAGKYLGTFYCEIEAAKAVDAASVEKYGPFAALNFPNN